MTEQEAVEALAQARCADAWRGDTGIWERETELYCTDGRWEWLIVNPDMKGFTY